MPTPQPQCNRHDREIRRDQHRAGHVGTDTDESIRLHQQIEEETLMQMFQQIIQAAADAFHRPAEGHLILPPVTFRLQRDCVDVIRNETAVGTGCETHPLFRHPTEHGLQALLVAVVVIPHFLDICADAHLSPSDGNRRIQKIEVGQLAVDAIIDDVQRLEAVVERILYDQGTL
jgi:hypothetical protein